MEFCLSRNSKTTYNSKAFAFRMLLREFSGRDSVSVVTKPKVLGCLTRIAFERTGGSANEIRKHLSAGWKWGQEFLGMPEKNPFCVPKFPADEKPRYVPSLIDFEKVHALTSGADYVMLLTALHTAARRGEIFRLVWEDVDFLHGNIRLGTRKRVGGGMQYDWVPITDTLAKALAEHKRYTVSELIFPGPRGMKYLTRSNFLKKLCAKAGVRMFGFHGIRHLSASLMARKDMKLPDIQSILRHTSSLTTAKYLHRLGILKQDLEGVFPKKD
jgi:integrase